MLEEGLQTRGRKRFKGGSTQGTGGRIPSPSLRTCTMTLRSCLSSFLRHGATPTRAPTRSCERCRLSLKADAKQRITEVERRQKAIQEKLDRLDEAFLYERTIDIERYDRHRDKLREELTLVQMDRHATELEELDVEGILAFAERVLPSASNLWVQSSLNQSSGCSSCFFLREFASTERALLEPA